jgi:RNA-directed DNA polymerase
VYCKDYKRRGSHEHTSFTFLGYTFRPRAARSKRTEWVTGQVIELLAARVGPRRA